ncbi:MAG: hypothetical protein EPO26_03640 [Chloroflexota bacterium]|nr:MAG: hypothetical protein EPO26_03640 [Chloroflexota bacterium]
MNQGVAFDAIAVQSRGDSMFPTIEPGAPLPIEPGGGAQCEVGDIVAIIGPNGAMMAHRLIAISNRFAWTRGDDAPWPDPPIPREAIVGRIAHGGRRGRLIARLPVLALLVQATDSRAGGRLPGLIARYVWRRIRRHRRP